MAGIIPRVRALFTRNVVPAKPLRTPFMAVEQNRPTPFQRGETNPAREYMPSNYGPRFKMQASLWASKKNSREV